MGSSVNSTKHSIKSIPKIKAKGILANSFYEARNTPISKLDRDITRIKNYKPIFLIKEMQKFLAKY